MSGSKDVHDDCDTRLERKQKKRYSEAFKCMVRVHRVVTVVQPQHEHVTSCEFNLSGTSAHRVYGMMLLLVAQNNMAQKKAAKKVMATPITFLNKTRCVVR
jgi:hypothetical protein